MTFEMFLTSQPIPTLALAVGSEFLHSLSSIDLYLGSPCRLYFGGMTLIDLFFGASVNEDDSALDGSGGSYESHLWDVLKTHENAGSRVGAIAGKHRLWYPGSCPSLLPFATIPDSEVWSSSSNGWFLVEKEGARIRHA